jgi:hypothetical protein
MLVEALAWDFGDDGFDQADLVGTIQVRPSDD